MYNDIFLEKLDMQTPIFQAGMAGGVTTADLVVRVCECGGLGQIGAGYMSPLDLEQLIYTVKESTNKPFGVNLFIPESPNFDQSKIDKMNNILNPINEALEVENVSKIDLEDNFDQMIEVIIRNKVKVVSFTFGKPSHSLVETLHTHNIIVIGTATHLNEAMSLEKVGVDLIVVQGSEAGGHRGSFNQSLPSKLLSTDDLFNEVHGKVDLPLIVAGGITTPLLASKYIKKGAIGVQLGTAFLTTEESGIPSVHKAHILKAKKEDIVLTRTFSGRYANGINNKFIKYMNHYMDDICPYPIQNQLTQNMRASAKKQQQIEYMSLWCGKNPEGTKEESVKELMERYKKEL